MQDQEQIVSAVKFLGADSQLHGSLGACKQKVQESCRSCRSVQLHNCVSSAWGHVTHCVLALML